MGTTAASGATRGPARSTRAAEAGAARPRVRASVARAARMDDREHQYDLLTAAVLGLTLGVGATLLLRRGPSGRRPIAPALMGMAKGAAWAGRGAAQLGRDGGRWAR